MKRKVSDVIFAAFFTLLVPAIGFISFGIWPAAIFFLGYFVGFVLWMLVPARTSFDAVKIPYLITFLLFILHRVEEKISGFFSVLAEMTGVPVPEVSSMPIILLLIVSVLAWILGPFLLRRGYGFGYYLVWSFFASMGVAELAHFIFPLFLTQPYGYFPGMISVFFLAPSAWFGMWRLIYGAVNGSVWNYEPDRGLQTDHRQDDR